MVIEFKVMTYRVGHMCVIRVNRLNVLYTLIIKAYKCWG
jgi:hypothetical protein